jgi:hypothetical protein
LQQLMHETSVFDFKATPKDIDALLGKVQAHLP